MVENRYDTPENVRNFFVIIGLIMVAAVVIGWAFG